MEPELIALASAGATTLVNLMLTDLWTPVKEKVLRIFGKENAAAEQSIVIDLEDSRAQLVAAAQQGDSDTIAEELRTEWQSRIGRAVRNNPGAIDPLNELVVFGQNNAPQMAESQLNFTAHAKNHGRVYQQGQGTQINY